MKNKYYDIIMLGLMMWLGFNKNIFGMILFSIFLCSIMAYKLYFQLNKKSNQKLVDGIIIDYSINKGSIIEDNANYLIKVNLQNRHFEKENLDLKVLFFKQPQKGEKVKILLNEDDINKSILYNEHNKTETLSKIIILILMVVVLSTYLVLRKTN